MKLKNKLFIIFIIFFHKVLLAGICDPETFSNDNSILLNSEYNNEINLQNRLLSLLREIRDLSNVTFTDKSEKAPVKDCLNKKEALFLKLFERTNQHIQDKALYHEIMGDFFSLKKETLKSLKSYDQALWKDSNNLGLLIKAYESYTATYGINLTNVSTINTQSHKTRVALEEASKRARKISEHPEAHKKYAIEHLYYQALIAQSLSQFDKEINLWEKVSTLNPKDAFAIRSRLKVFFIQRDSPNIQKEFNKLVRHGFDDSKDWEQTLSFLVNNKYHQEFITLYKKSPDEFKRKHPALKIFLTRSMLDLGRVQEAKDLLKEINFKISAPFSKIDGQNKARIYELDADDFKKQDRLSEALDLYKKALSSSPNPLTVKEKISFLIYEYRKSLNFKPPEATQKDLQEVIELLYKSAFETELKTDLFEIYLHSLNLTQNTKTLQKACLRFIHLYPKEKNKIFYKDNCLR